MSQARVKPAYPGKHIFNGELTAEKAVLFCKEYDLDKEGPDNFSLFVSALTSTSLSFVEELIHAYSKSQDSDKNTAARFCWLLANEYKYRGDLVKAREWHAFAIKKFNYIFSVEGLIQCLKGIDPTQISETLQELFQYAREYASACAHEREPNGRMILSDQEIFDKLIAEREKARAASSHDTEEKLAIDIEKFHLERREGLRKRFERYENDFKYYIKKAIDGILGKHIEIKSENDLNEELACALDLQFNSLGHIYRTYHAINQEFKENSIDCKRIVELTKLVMATLDPALHQQCPKSILYFQTKALSALETITQLAEKQWKHRRASNASKWCHQLCLMLIERSKKMNCKIQFPASILLHMLKETQNCAVKSITGAISGDIKPFCDANADPVDLAMLEKLSQENFFHEVVLKVFGKDVVKPHYFLKAMQNDKIQSAFNVEVRRLNSIAESDVKDAAISKNGKEYSLTHLFSLASAHYKTTGFRKRLLTLTMIALLISNGKHAQKKFALSETEVNELKKYALENLKEMLESADNKKTHRRVAKWCYELCKLMFDRAEKHNWYVEQPLAFIKNLIEDARNDHLLTRDGNIDLITIRMDIDIGTIDGFLHMSRVDLPLSNNDAAVSNQFKQENLLQQFAIAVLGEDKVKKVENAEVKLPDPAQQRSMPPVAQVILEHGLGMPPAAAEQEELKEENETYIDMLFFAALQGDDAGIRSLLPIIKDINTRINGKLYSPALLAAISANKASSIELLIRHGAAYIPPQSENLLAAQNALKTQDKDIVTMLQKLDPLELFHLQRIAVGHEQQYLMKQLEIMQSLKTQKVEAAKSAIAAPVLVAQAQPATVAIPALTKTKEVDPTAAPVVAALSRSQNHTAPAVANAAQLRLFKDVESVNAAFAALPAIAKTAAVPAEAQVDKSKLDERTLQFG